MKRGKEMIPEVFEREVIAPLLDGYRAIMPDEELREIHKSIANLLDEARALGPKEAMTAQILVRTTLEIGLDMVKATGVFEGLVPASGGDDGDTETTPS